MYNCDVPFQISKYATGWGGGNTDVCLTAAKFTVPSAVHEICQEHH